MTNAAAVFEKARKSVVVVRVFDSDGKQFAQGSGVITAENEVTTNYHVVEKAKRVEVSQEGEKKAIAAEVKSGDADRDLCLLSANGLTDAAEIRDTKNLKIGEDVFAIGSPRKLEFSISNGIVSQLRALKDGSPLIQTNAAISEGSSGGGLFDSNGKLVGITTSSYKKGQNLNFALPTEWIADVRLNQSPFSKSAPQISAGESLGFLDKAVELQEAEDWNGMLAHCKRWTEAAPKNALAQFCLGVAYSNINRYDDAIVAYREALRINPEYVDAWYNLGVVYGNLGRYDDAVAAYREALRINSELADPWNNLGVTYGRELGRPDDAIAAFREALRISPEHVNAWNNLGNAYANIDRHDDAIAAFREAVRINPQLAEAWNNLGIAYGNLGRYDDTIAAYREAVRINPEHANAWNNLGFAYSKLDRYDDAIAVFREAVRINPEHANAWNNLGIAYYNLKRYDDAIAAWRKALRIRSEDADAWNNLGVVYGNLGRHDDAIAAYREALRINPQYAEVWKNLSIAYRQVGRNAEADEANQKHLRAKILSEK